MIVAHSYIYNMFYVYVCIICMYIYVYIYIRLQNKYAHMYAYCLWWHMYIICIHWQLNIYFHIISYYVNYNNTGGPHASDFYQVLMWASGSKGSNKAFFFFFFFLLYFSVHTEFLILAKPMLN